MLKTKQFPSQKNLPDGIAEKQLSKKKRKERNKTSHCSIACSNIILFYDSFEMVPKARLISFVGNVDFRQCLCESTDVRERIHS